MPTLNRPEENVQALKGLIGWFNQSSFDLIQEYRRLEERADSLKQQLEAKHQQLESSLREREEARAYLLSVLESLKAGVLVLDRNLHPTFVNRRITELIGDVDDERAVQLLGETLAASLRRGERSFLPLECEKVVQRPDGAMAARIATDYLARLGPNAPYIVSLTLERSAIVRGKTSWVARWSRAIDVEGDRELGLRVNLDGTTVRLVEDKSSSSRARGNNINR